MASIQQLPPQIQSQLAQFQQIQEQLQVVIQQRYQLEAQLNEIDRTLEELKKISKDTTLFKSIGMVLIKVENKEELEKELEDKKEMLAMRIKTVVRQEETLKEKHQSLQEKLQSALAQYQGSGGVLGAG